MRWRFRAAGILAVALAGMALFVGLFGKLSALAPAELAAILGAALALSMLGTAIPAARVGTLWRRRRAWAQLQDRLHRQEGAALAIGSSGRIVAQTPSSVAQMGNMVGCRVTDMLALRHADPAAAWRELGRQLARSREYRADLGPLGVFLIRREMPSAWQIWTAEELPAASLAEAPRAGGRSSTGCPCRF